MSAGSVVAVDLGATSGRVMVGRVGDGELSLHPLARFPNQPVRIADGLHWSILELYRSVLDGLRTAVREAPDAASAGIDSWDVDYALLRGNRMLGTPFHYRDERTAAGVSAVHEKIAPADLYAENGLQFLRFNTLYQLATEELTGELADERMLLIPDLLGFWLTGVQVAERTNASTTGLLEVTSGTWNDDLIATVGLPRSLFPPVVEPGTRIGRIGSGPRGTDVGGTLDLVAVGSHDTASAVVAAPATSDRFAYISCGTWGLVGVELPHPVLSEAAREAGFTNEGGVDGRVRFLHNVMGLWLQNESVREWERSGETIDLPALLDAAAGVTTPVAVFDASDPAFLAPGDMPGRIADHCRERGLPVPGTRAEFIRSIIESLADAFANAVRMASELSGQGVDVVHLVGGGSQNELLCQLTADRTGLPVLAGPVEATAIGNVLVQARAAGFVTGSLESLRALVAASFPPRRYLPRG